MNGSRRDADVVAGSTVEEMMPRLPIVIGHRGAPGYRPEHSRAAYRVACAMGVDAVEPDVVVSADGVLVVRHENEISETTDVASRPEFADRRTTKTVDGRRLTGWFTEDFAWSELSTLRCRERLPAIRPNSATFDGTENVLCLRDVLDLVADAAGRHDRRIGVVLEIKHPTYFASLGWDMAALVASELHAAGWASPASAPGSLVVESFEQTVLDEIGAASVSATRIYLIEATGTAADLVAARRPRTPTYTDQLRPPGLDALAGSVDGISVSKSRLLSPGRDEPGGVVEHAHARGLLVYTWTCRPENTFLSRPFRRPGGKGAFGDYVAEWATLRDIGVDGVFVDHPDLGVQVFRPGAEPGAPG